MPCWAVVADGKTHEVNLAKGLEFSGWNDSRYGQGLQRLRPVRRLVPSRSIFVTRLKSNAQFKVVRKRQLPQTGNVLADEEIVFTGYQASRVCPNVLRRVVIWDDENDREIVLLTNHLPFGATTIGRIYKDRWQIELFFKALKQNLKVKTFVGTSENAVKIQIWTALIAILLLKLMQLKSSFGWSLSSLAAMVRMNLLTYRDLWSWLDDPYKFPARPPEEIAMPLFSQN